jgi:Carboxypeptidase regulatory-like domain
MIRPKSVLLPQARRLLTVMLALLLVQFAAFGQAESGQISGIVTDENGGLVPGASVVARNEKTGEDRTATSATDGAYTIASLKPSTYTVTVTTTGLATTATNVQVLVSP